MNLTLRIPDDLARRIAAAGVNPEHVALEALQHAADDLEGKRRAGAIVRRSPAEAAARMRQSRAGNVLPEGMSVRDLMTFGRA